MSEPRRQQQPEQLGVTDREIEPDRRRFIANASRVAMVAGLAAGYGTFGYIAGRFLYPAEAGTGIWQFVSEADGLRPGESLLYTGPSGETINIARQGATGGVDDFIALSSTCPHLGCQVHWEPQNDRFFCPCHNGIFDPSGVATGGPPGDAGQSLPRYPLRIEEELLYIQVPRPRFAASGPPGHLPEDTPGRLAATADAGPGRSVPGRRRGLRAPGHDACLGPAPGGGEERSG